MHIALSRALKSINLTDDQAADVVKAVEEHVAVRIEDGTKGVESKLTALTWVIGAVGAMLAAIGLAPAFVKLFQ